MSVLIVAAAMLITAAPALAQVERTTAPEIAGGATEPQAPATATEPTTTDTATTTTEAAAATEAELVCRNVSERTESRLRSRRTRVCKTQAEWDAQDQAAQRERSGQN